VGVRFRMKCDLKSALAKLSRLLMPAEGWTIPGIRLRHIGRALGCGCFGCTYGCWSGLTLALSLFLLGILIRKKYQRSIGT
jgi:hypothetical protein